MKKNNNRHAVILAGGSGTRFWPLSRKAKPKQFLSLLNEQTLFQQTLERIRPLVPVNNIWIVSGDPFAREIAIQAKPFAVPSANILLEPVGRNTAPAIAWAAAKIFRRDPEAVMAVLPADHVITNPRRFRCCLNTAFQTAQGQSLVTLGIPPTRPETGYGYIMAQPDRRGGKASWIVRRFTEKPSLAKARQFLKTKRHYWNSGMFVWRADQILTEFSIHLPVVYEKVFNRPDRHVRKAWPHFPSISVDYAILEKADNVAMVLAEGIGWTDLGSWEALYELLPKDPDGNVMSGEVVALASQRTYVHGGVRPVAVVGVSDLVIVDTPDALLICRRDLTQGVREVVASLKARHADAFI